MKRNNDQVLANVIQRLNDSFSAENSDCLTTLGLMLRFVSSLLGDPIFAEEANLAGELTLSLPTFTLASNRELRLSSLQLRQLLRWTGETGNPVRDLTSLLEVDCF